MELHILAAHDNSCLVDVPCRYAALRPVAAAEWAGRFTTRPVGSRRKPGSMYLDPLAPASWPFRNLTASPLRATVASWCCYFAMEWYTQPKNWNFWCGSVGCRSRFS